MASVFSRFYQNPKGVVTGRTESNIQGSTGDNMDFELLISDQSVGQFDYLQSSGKVLFRSPDTGRKYPVYCNCYETRAYISQCPHIANERIQQLLFAKYKHQEIVMKRLAKSVNIKDMNCLYSMLSKAKHNCDDFSLISLRELCKQAIIDIEVENLSTNDNSYSKSCEVVEEQHKNTLESLKDVKQEKMKLISSYSNDYSDSTDSEFKNLIINKLNAEEKGRMISSNSLSCSGTISHEPNSDGSSDLNSFSTSDKQDESLLGFKRNKNGEVDNQSARKKRNKNKPKINVKMLEQTNERTIKLLNIYFIEALRFSDEINRELIKILSKEPCEKCKAFFETLDSNGVHNIINTIRKSVSMLGCPQCVNTCHLVTSIIDDYKMMSMFEEENSRASLAAAYCLATRGSFIELPKIVLNAEQKDDKEVQQTLNIKSTIYDEVTPNEYQKSSAIDQILPKTSSIHKSDSRVDKENDIISGVSELEKKDDSIVDASDEKNRKEDEEEKEDGDEDNPLKLSETKLNVVPFLPLDKIKEHVSDEKMVIQGEKNSFLTRSLESVRFENKGEFIHPYINQEEIDLKLLCQVIAGIGLIKLNEVYDIETNNQDSNNNNDNDIISIKTIVSERSILDNKIIPKIFQTSGRNVDRTNNKRGISSNSLNPGSKAIGVSVKLSFGCNVLLAVLKLVGLILSGSMIMIASFLDSILDILSGLVLVVSDVIAKRRNSNDSTKYPIGKQRIHTIGFLVFACVMATFTLEIIISAITTLVSGTSSVEFGAWPISILVVTVVLKCILWTMCQTVGKKYDSEACKAYAQDHRNDVLSNIVGLCFGLMTDYLAWWLDPTGSILISLYILINWVITAFSLIKILLGQSASRKFISTIIFVACNFSEEILAIDFIEAFHSGKQVIVELHVVLPRDMSLERSHDIGEALQTHIEKLEKVERCFVHVDVDSTHKNEKKRGID